MKLGILSLIAGTALLTNCSRGNQDAKDVLAASAGEPGRPATLMKRAPEPEFITVPNGSVVRVRTETTISTKDARNGETLHATLTAPVVINGVVVAPSGADATLVVADSDPGGRVKGRARLGLRLASVSFSREPTSVVSDTFWREAPGTKKKDAMKIGILSGIGAGIGAIAGGGKGAAIGAGAGGGAGTAVVLSTRGDPAVVASESVIAFRLEQPVKVRVKT